MWNHSYKLIVFIALIMSGTAGALSYCHATFATQREYDNLRQDIAELKKTVVTLQSEILFRLDCTKKP